MVERELDRLHHVSVEALRSPPLGLPAIPPQLRAYYRLEQDDSEGFVTLRQAAELLGQGEEEVRRLAERGILRSRGRGPSLVVEPAVVSIVAVRDR